MPENKGSTDVQGLYGALIGGMVASFVAVAVFRVLLGGDGAPGTWAALTAVLVGLACAITFMVGGLWAGDRARWIGSALLYASGFTTLWSVGVSFGAEQSWAVLLALGVAIAIGVILGWRHFGRAAKDTALGEDEAPRAMALAEVERPAL